MKPAVEDSIAKAMATFIPDLKWDYQEFVRRTLDRAKEELGPGLPRVYSNWKWCRTFQGTLRPNIVKQYPDGRPVVLTPSESDRLPYIIDEAKLEANSQKYAEGMAYQWYGKMVSKLGDLDNVDIHYIQGGDLLLTGNRGPTQIRISQQRILKSSSRGTLFHQWPARIYVDGKFTPETEYKKLTRRSNGETDDKSKGDIRGGVQRTEHVRVSGQLAKGKQSGGGSRARHDKEAGEIHGIH